MFEIWYALEMKRFSLWLGIIAIISIVFIAALSHFRIAQDAPVTYVHSLPGSIMAMTIPPFGIYIEDAYRDEGDAKGSILAHERIHWLQYQERGLLGFYGCYIKGWLQNGRLYNELEIDARKRSM